MLRVCSIERWWCVKMTNNGSSASEPWWEQAGVRDLAVQTTDCLSPAWKKRLKGETHLGNVGRRCWLAGYVVLQELWDIQVGDV